MGVIRYWGLELDGDFPVLEENIKVKHVERKEKAEEVGKGPIIKSLIYQHKDLDF